MKLATRHSARQGGERAVPRARHGTPFWALTLAVAWPMAAFAADPQPYTVDLHKTGIADIDSALAGSSSLITLRKSAPAGPFALVGRARSDIDRLQTVLGGFGYYDAAVTVSVDAKPVADPALPNVLAAVPNGHPVTVTIGVTLGPLFHLRYVTIEGAIGTEARPASALQAFDLHAGEPAVASKVLTAGSNLLASLQNDGHAFATVSEPIAYEIPAEHALDVTFKVVEGPRVDLGPIDFMGLHSVNPRYLRRRLTIHPGELYQPSRIEAARQDLAGTGVFTTVQATSAKHLDASGRLPITFSFVEAPPRTVALTAAYSTDLGGSAGVTWTHHNFFGNAEQLELAAIATGLGGSAQEGLGYDVYAQLTKPDFLARDQSLRVRVEALKQNLYAYDQTAELAEIGLTRRISKRWDVGGNLLIEQERFIQEGTTRDYTLGQIPLTANFDDTDLASPLEDPTHGFRIGLGVTPSESLGNGRDGPGTSARNSFFAIIQAQASTYFDFARLNLAKPGRSVLAVRGVIASVQGATTFELPPDQRLYAGGSTTVRGYQYQQISPLFPDNRPIGGTSLDAVQVEMRQRIVGKIGAVLFADAGQVGTSSAPGHGPLRIGAGAGVRYYTPIGPIRLDLAVPLSRIPGDSSFQLYIGLGEAF